MDSFYKTVLDYLYDAVYFVDKNRKIIYWNKSAEELTGYAYGDMVRSYCYQNRLKHTGEDGVLLCRGGCPLAKTLADGCTREEKIYLQHKDGHRIPIFTRISPVRNESNEIIGAVEVFNDNTLQAQLAEELARFKELALLDSLTELGNKRYVELELSGKTNEMYKAGKTLFGILFADIDHFKRVNDQYGHDVGDRILKMVAKTIQNSIGGRGTAFRWGGEEFLIIVNTEDKEELVKVAERIRVMTEQSMFCTPAEEIRVTISLGATMAEVSDTVDTLVKRADELLFYSKHAGRNRVTSA